MLSTEVDDYASIKSIYTADPLSAGTSNLSPAQRIQRNMYAGATAADVLGCVTSRIHVLENDLHEVRELCRTEPLSKEQRAHAEAQIQLILLTIASYRATLDFEAALGQSDFACDPYLPDLH